MESFSVDIENADDNEVSYGSYRISEEYRYELETLVFKLHKQTLKDQSITTPRSKGNDK